MLRPQILSFSPFRAFHSKQVYNKVPQICSLFTSMDSSPQDPWTSLKATCGWDAKGEMNQPRDQPHDPNPTRTSITNPKSPRLRDMASDHSFRQLSSIDGRGYATSRPSNLSRDVSKKQSLFGK